MTPPGPSPPAWKRGRLIAAAATLAAGLAAAAVWLNRAPPPPSVQQARAVPVPAAVAPAPAPAASPGPSPPVAVAAPAPVPSRSPPPVAAAHPPPAPPEPLRAAALRPLIDAVLQQALCAIVTASVPEQGPVELTGFSIGPAALLDQIAGATGGARELRWHGEAVKAPLCAAVEAIRPVLTPPGVSGLALDVPGGLSLREGDPIQPRIVLPGFPAFLRVDDILSDGTLVHLYPSLASTGPKGQTIAAQPDRLFAPREVFRLGLPGQARGGAGLPVYPAGEPFGTDLIVAIAATAPIGVLVGGNPAGNDEDEAGTAAYIAALAQYLAHLRPGGDRVEAAAVLVHTRP